MDKKLDVAHDEVVVEEKNYGNKQVPSLSDVSSGKGNASVVQNVLAHLSREELLADVDQMVLDKGLQEHSEIFRKGAIVAQTPHLMEEMQELDEEEKRVLREEFTHKWRQPLMLYVTIFICSVSAVVDVFAIDGKLICSSGSHCCRLVQVRSKE